MITADQLLRICPRATPSLILEVITPLEAALITYDISTPLRIAAFLAQVAHETHEFRYREEIWGPTSQQKKYEPPGKLAETLGNTEPGDGYRYRGRGPLMLTGRANYRRFGEKINRDLIDAPDQVSRWDVGFEVAGAYWQARKCNTPADAGAFETLTRIINGGLTHYVERVAYFQRALMVLARQTEPKKPR